MIKFGKKKAVNSDTDKDKNKKTAVKHDEHKIEIINVNKTYDMGRESLHVLKNINFTVDEGEFVAILGPSGSGKSTLMNVIGCMDLFDEGEYYLDGLAIHAMKEKKLTGIRNEKIGFIFQNYHLILYTPGLRSDLDESITKYLMPQRANTDLRQRRYRDFYKKNLTLGKAIINEISVVTENIEDYLEKRHQELIEE